MTLPCTEDRLAIGYDESVSAPKTACVAGARQCCETAKRLRVPRESDDAHCSREGQLSVRHAALAATINVVLQSKM